MFSWISLLGGGFGNNVVVFCKFLNVGDSFGGIRMGVEVGNNVGFFLGS